MTEGTALNDRRRPRKTLAVRAMEFAGGDEWRGNDVPPEARSVYYIDGKEVPRGTPDAYVIASNNDGFELWFGTAHKWYHHMRSADVHILLRYIIWEWFAKARWFGLRRPIYYWALHRHVERSKRNRKPQVVEPVDGEL